VYDHVTSGMRRLKLVRVVKCQIEEEEEDIVFKPDDGLLRPKHVAGTYYVTVLL
jgi:hypothetical protein